MKNNIVVVQLHKYYKPFTYFVFLPLFFVFIMLIYYKRAGAFSFIDEYNNFMAGYYLLQKKTMYSQIFFQHQPLMAYISAALQFILHPSSMYKLVLYHRLFILFFSLLFNALLVYRFKFLGVFFAVFYEITKYYLFGNLFLGESLVVYPLTYLFLLAWEKLQKLKINNFEIIISGIFTYFIVCTREPFIPVTVCLYGFILFGKIKRVHLLSIAIFIIFTAVTILSLPLKEYIFELTAVNYLGVIQGETQVNGLHGIGILKIFIYPILLFFNGKINIFREITIAFDILFLTACVTLVYFKKYKELLFIIFFLGLCAVRIVVPGTIFYEAYHIVPWYGVFLVSIVCMLQLLYKKNQLLFKVSVVFAILIGCFMFLSPQMFLWEKIDRNQEFNTSYGRFYLFGNVITMLSKPTDTIFVDSWDSLIYWQAKLPIAYPYIFYYPPMNFFPVYTNARTAMFTHNAPDFYYFYCGEIHYYSPGIPKQYKSMYKELYNKEGKSCLYVKKSKLSQISSLQWSNAKSLGFYLP